MSFSVWCPSRCRSTRSESTVTQSMNERSIPGRDGFVGRGRELHELASCLERGARLVTIVGSPGIGKTRLVQEFLRRLDAERTSEIRWHRFCDLSELRDPRELTSSVARQIGLEPATRKSRRSVAAVVTRALAARGRGILVLDNVEQIAGPVVQVIDEWHEAAPELVVLCTSRERLRAPGEVCLEVGSLGLPSTSSPDECEAVTLFVERARSHHSTFSLSSGAARTVADLVTLLDGVPLAIELAAARVGVMNVDELLRRVSTDIDVLSRGVRSASRRQSTLRSAVEWSWDLLSPLERDVLSRCSVFRGGFGLVAAEQVLRDVCTTHPVLDVLHALRDKSLVRVTEEGPPRFSLSFGIREIAAERLASAALEDETRNRHAKAYRALAAAARAELERTGCSDSALALERDRDNLMAAYEYVEGQSERASPGDVLDAIVALAPILLAQGPIDRLLELVEAYLARSDARSVDPALYARCLQARARALQLSASLDAAERDFETALALMPPDADRWQMAALLVDAGVLHHQRRHLERARDCYTRALDLYEQNGSVRQRARVLGDIGALHHDQRQFDVAETYYRRALRLLSRVDEPRLGGNILANLGLLASEAGRLGEADACLERAEATLASSSDRRLLGVVRGNRGALAFERGELEQARHLLGLAIRDLSEFGDSTSEALCLARHAAVEATLSGTGDWWKQAFAAEQLIDGDEDPLTLITVRLYAAVAELASLTPPSSEPLRRAKMLVEAARQPRHDTGSSLADLSDDARAALRLLERRLSHIEPLSAALISIPEDALVVGPDATWFRPPGGVSQALGAHGPIRRILLALSARHGDALHHGFGLEELREIGWPGEKIQTDSAANRVHVALAELRRRGLKAFIVRLSRGYALSDRLTVVRSDVPFPTHGGSESQ